MTEEFDKEKDTLDDPSQEEVEETAHDESDSSDGEDTPKTSVDDTDEEVDWKAEAEKWKDTATNYKREIETKGLRKKELKEKKPSGKKETERFEVDYLSKREDILDQFSSDFDSLDEESFKKLKTILNPALDSVYESATEDSRFVARGELERTVRDLVDFAKGSKANQEEIEKARLEGAKDREKLSDAEIKGKSTVKATEGYSEEVRNLAKEKGWELDVTKRILENRKKRQQEYKPRHRF